MSLDLLTPTCCPSCDSPTVKPHTTYTLHTGEGRTIYVCSECAQYFSQTYATPLAGLRTPLSRIQMILDALNDGMGVNAVCRTFHVSKNTLADWSARLADLTDTLLLYALSYRFLQQVVEGDEVYTKVHANVPAPESEGWTMVLMDRASRFLWELQCGEKDRLLFEQTMHRLVQVTRSEQTGDLNLVTDGERRYGNMLFELCRQVVRTGQPDRPKQTLPEGVRVRVKNKGSQAHRRGRKRPKYQAPQPEHACGAPPRPPWPRPIFTLIIWKPSMLPCAVGSPAISARPTLTQKNTGLTNPTRCLLALSQFPATALHGQDRSGSRFENSRRRFISGATLSNASL